MSGCITPTQRWTVRRPCLVVDRHQLFRAFKYAVYALLSLNILLFLRENHLAAVAQFPGGVPFADLIDTYAETIDTAAWVVLLLMFEVETTIFERNRPGIKLTRMLKGIRMICYTLIVYAFYGYLARTAAIDPTPNPELYLAWLDVLNAAVWLLVVLVLEIDVRLQEHGRLDGLVLRVSNAIKPVFYTLLMLAAIYWGRNGDFVDFWDAFLWLVAFVSIELNVFGWRQWDNTETKPSNAYGKFEPGS